MRRRYLFWLFMFATLSGCSQSVTAPLTLPTITDITQYFWSYNSAPMMLKDSSGNQTVLTFSDSAGLLRVNDGSATSLLCSISKDSIYVANFTQGSVVDLDPYSYFSTLDTEMLVTSSPHAMIVWDNPKQPIIATGFGVFAYDTSSNSFKPTGLANVSDITVLAGDNDRQRLYAPTASGNIWYSTGWPTPKTGWSLLLHSGLPAGPIMQFIVFNKTLYATVGGTHGIYVSQDGTSWSPISYLTDKQIVTIGGITTTGSSYLMAATSDGFIGAFPVNSGTSLPPVQVAGMGKVYCFGASQTGIPLAGTDDGLYQWDAPSNSWSIYSPLANYKHVVSFLTQDSSFYFAADGSTYYGLFSGSHVALLPAIPNGSPIQLGYTNYLCALTTEGFDFFRTAWQPIPGLDLSDYPYVAGGLILLRANPDTGKSWRAGTLVTQTDEKSYAITARVMKRLNALEISGQNYPDVLMIRYAYEKANDIPESRLLPYWVIYYQKGVGPIMFEKVRTVGGIENVIERRAIKSQ